MTTETTTRDPEDEQPKRRAESEEARPKAREERPEMHDADEADKKERAYRKEWLPTELERRLDNIRKSVHKLYDEHKRLPQLPGFTPHSHSHCQGVEDLIHRLIPGARFKKLREYERYLLLASAWLHDLGMIAGLLDGDGSSPSMEQIRSRHHERSEDFIVNNPARCGITEEVDAPILGLLARLHGDRIEEALEQQNVGGHEVRVRLIAAYLCLADALHIDASRAPSDAYAICLAYNVPVATKIHWIKSRFVSGIHIDAEKHRIVLQFKKPNPSQEQDLRRQGVNTKGIRRIHDLVARDVDKNLSRIKNELFKGEVAYYLTVEREEAAMHLDKQVLRDLKVIVNSPDFMANPSSSRLAELMLRTVADILDLDESGCVSLMPPKPGEQLDQRKKVREFLVGLKSDVLKQRPCHLSLSGLVEELEGNLEASEALIKQREYDEHSPVGLKEWGGSLPPYDVPGGTVQGRRWEPPTPGAEPGKAPDTPVDPCKPLAKDPLVAYISKQLRDRKRVRQRVRMAGKQYMSWFLKQGPSQKGAPPAEQGAGAHPWPRKRPITILLYGYSELVIKALCGFRDEVLKWLLEQYLLEHENWGLSGSDGFIDRLEDPIPSPGLDFQRPFHLQRLERMGADHFRIFVCSGEPKNASETSEELGFQDGYNYVDALARHGFTNLIRITDLAAVGNLLHRTWDGGNTHPGPPSDVRKDPMVDLILMGVNGIEVRGEGEQEVVEFKHSMGQLALSAAVASLSKIYGTDKGLTRFTRLPRLVFVASNDKFKIKPSASPCGGGSSKARPTRPVPQEFWTWLEAPVRLVHGYWIQEAFQDEPIRDKPFLLPHHGQEELFHREGVRLYTPREEAVWCSLVDDLIWDDGFFYGDSQAQDLFKRDLQGHQPRRGQVRMMPKWDNFPHGENLFLQHLVRLVPLLHRAFKVCKDGTKLWCDPGLNTTSPGVLAKGARVEILEERARDRDLPPRCRVRAQDPAEVGWVEADALEALNHSDALRKWVEEWNPADASLRSGLVASSQEPPAFPDSGAELQDPTSHS